MSFGVTLTLLTLGAALSLFCLWHQRRPRELGDVSLFPANILLGVGLIVMVLAMAHLVSLFTGHPFTGRMGR